MSHVTTIEVKESYTLLSLKQMCKDMGWQWQEGQKTYRWYGKHVGDYPIPVGFTRDDVGRCDHAIGVPGAKYEIGVVRKGNEWKLLWDFYGVGGLQQVLGKEAGLLKQAYAMANTKVTARKNRRNCFLRPAPVHLEGWKKHVISIPG